MSSYPEKKNDKSDSIWPKAQLPVSDKAKAIHLQIVDSLIDLNNMKVESCCDSAFKACFTTFLSLFGQYQREVLDGVQFTPTCKSGCFCCCNHWVEDVNSFEAEIISEYIFKTYPQAVPSIIKTCDKDLIALENVENCMARHPQLENGIGEEFDQIDLLLSVFYQLKKPCPLLDSNGKCIIYHIRPLTCRIYMSFSPPSRCEPEYINHDDIPTYLLDVDECAGDLLDKLHFKFVRFQGDTGLRSLLSKYLDAFSKKSLPSYRR